MDQQLLRVPTPRIERHASEPAPSTSAFLSQPQRPHAPTANSSLLAVPQSAYLVKQHSHPLLPSQTASNANIVIQRQLSQPGPRSTSRVSHHRLQPQSSMEIALDSYAPSGEGLGNRSTPPSIRVVAAAVGGRQSPHLLVPGAEEKGALPPNLTQLISTHMRSSSMNEECLGGDVESSGHQRTTGTPPLLIVPGTVTGSLDYAPSLRVKDELQRSISTPQAPTREFSLDNPRSSHCPAIRPGPALGCNFCWNTIDAHGRILRRKTKYHCPECQTNLCIVPCFQEYHERQANEAAVSTTTTTTTTTTTASSSAGSTRGASPGRAAASSSPGEKLSEASATASNAGKTKPSLRFSSFGAMSSSSTTSSPSVDSGGSQTATTAQHPPDFSRSGSLQ